jgi:hypothetical protein
VVSVLKERIYPTQWVDQVVRLVRQEIARVTVNTESILQPLENTRDRLTRQIEAAERRIIHVPEDSLATVLDELEKLKKERAAVQANIDSTRASAGNPINQDAMEERIRGRIAHLWEVLEGGKVMLARQELVRHIEKVVIAPDKRAWLYPKPDGLLDGLGVMELLLPQKHTAPASDGGGRMAFVGIPDEI